MPWKKGESGNPGGRPRENAEIRKLARRHGPEAVERLVELMRGDNPRVASHAAQALLDRAYGRPHQSMDLGVEGATISAEPVAMSAEGWAAAHCKVEQ